MIILCADDYGISDGVSRGILELCAAGRLSATSAMVTFERWSQDAERLSDIRPGTAIGLHLNLTLGRPLTDKTDAANLTVDGAFLSIGQLIRRAGLIKIRAARTKNDIDLIAVQAEFYAQIAAFRDATGQLPDFIDGHQHVHVLYQIRPALLDAIEQFSWRRPPFVRVPSSEDRWLRAPRRDWSKRGLLYGLSKGMRRQLKQSGLPTNDTFGGFSSFEIGRDYCAELVGEFENAGECHLVMCHPGYRDDELLSRGDPVVNRRPEELQGILAFDRLAERIWHPMREADGSIDWHKAMAA